MPGLGATAARIAALCAVLVASAAADAQSPPDPAPSGGVRAAVCADETLTVCQGDFCTVTFRPGGKLESTFDFVKKTYTIPSMGRHDVPMTGPKIDHFGTTFSAKFGVELDKPVDVEFLSNKPAGGTFEMTAARRLSYPATADRPSIIVISAARCHGTAP